jgi:hypothetical protein
MGSWVGSGITNYTIEVPNIITPTLQQVVTQAIQSLLKLVRLLNLQVNEQGTVGLNITSTLGGIGIKSSSTGGSSGQEFTNSGVNSWYRCVNTKVVVAS